MRFHDRADAGKRLAAALQPFNNDHPLVIYALPRGGIILGAIVAKNLGAPLSLIISRKIGHPSYPEYAVAAVTAEGAVLANPAEIISLDETWLQNAVERERREIKRRETTYFDGLTKVNANEKTVIIVDDGVATGLTMLAAIYEVRRDQPRRIIVATPVMTRSARDLIQNEADEIVALLTPDRFEGAIGAYYDDFKQVDDVQVRHILRQANTSSD